MLLKTQTVRHYLRNLGAIFSSRAEPILNPTIPASPISTLKVKWRKDHWLDEAIASEKRYKLCARVVNEVLLRPGQLIPLRYLEKRRKKLRLNIKAQIFVKENPNLFEVYYDRIKPKTDLVKFIRPTESLRQFLKHVKRIYEENEALVVSKLCKLLMMTEKRVLSVDKLVHVKRDFGLPYDFMTRLVPKYPELFKIHGSGKEGETFLELVTWDPSYAKSAIELRAEEESRHVGIRIRPNFTYKLPPGFILKKEMREWVRDWLELEYISPYDHDKQFKGRSPEREKRSVAVFHELLWLSLKKRVPVPTLGKFTEDYGFSNSFTSTFTRHSGIFYMSLKGGVRTAVLREAYKGGRLAIHDPLLEINDRFVKLLTEGWRMRKKGKSEENKKDMAVKGDVGAK